MTRSAGLDESPNPSIAPPSGPMDTLFDKAPIGFAFLDGDLRCLRINEKFAEMMGIPADRTNGSIIEMLPKTTTDLSQVLQEVLVSGEPVVDLEVEGQAPGQVSRLRSWLLSAYPIPTEPPTEKGQRNGLGLILNEVTARKREDQNNRFLADAGKQLVASLDYRALLARITNLSVPFLGEFCVIEIDDGNESGRHMAAAHVDPEKASLLKAPGSAEGTERLAALKPAGTMTVPLSANGKTFGSIVFGTSDPTAPYDETDRSVAEELGRRASLALENARVHSERTHVARTLQASLLPSRLPEVEGIEVVARHHPGRGNEVGGDFYDFFDTGDGAFAALIGDVCGKGAEAAAVTGLARHTVRAAAAGEVLPSAVLERLNSAMLTQRNDHRFCTVCYVRLEARREHLQVTVCCGGHPLPIVLRSNGGVEQPGRAGSLLGVLDDPDLFDETFALNEGDCLILYTDGVVEARRIEGGDIFGNEKLIELVGQCRGLDAKAIAQKVEKTVLEFQSDEPRDDTAVLVIRFLGTPTDALEPVEENQLKR